MGAARGASLRVLFASLELLTARALCARVCAQPAGAQQTQASCEFGVGLLGCVRAVGHHAATTQTTVVMHSNLTQAALHAFFVPAKKHKKKRESFFTDLFFFSRVF
jgi:hypothetical protein